VCENLIGLKYRLGADGSNGEIDCIHLVLQALRNMGFDAPDCDRRWYRMSKSAILEELQRYTDQVAHPVYNGDIAAWHDQRPAFGVTWETGILFVNQQTKRVDWKPVDAFTIHHCFRMKSI
jgi:cell wall-associated NlpC family hydrolase